MAKPFGLRIATAVQEAWATWQDFPNRTGLINSLVDKGLGFRRQRMFEVIGNVWEKANAPVLDPDTFRFDRVPSEFMAELQWDREDRFGIIGDAIYEDQSGNLERHRTMFYTDSYAEGLEYEQEWGEKVAAENRYPALEYIGFEIGQVWHKKGADYGHPMLQEL